ncbi:Ubiquitin fusion degradation protein 1 homolog [Durusdinium trenchii]|uniref:Ubiquitin fusion degradation protein 1 homolog n=1 Tax=Durusdinium trenchii TaxID=1381693 RepID=A0ABP0LQ47_9DINO
MDLEFRAAAKKLEREREAERRRREKQKAQERRAKEDAAKAQERVRALAEQKRLQRVEAARQAAEQEEQRRTGVHFAASLRAVPFVKANTNRVVLPKSVLEALERQRALDVVKGPMTFALSVNVVDGETTTTTTTHCGVDEFTAEEGTVAIPPAVALSLARERGVDWLTGRQVAVEFVELERHERVKIECQPRGGGFHVGDQEVVNIDLKSVLMRTLRDVLTLTTGDWIPVRHEGKNYHLVVRSISPEPAVLVLNTDVEVDLLPSESVEQEQQRKKAQHAARERRQAVIEAIAAALPPEPPASEPGLVTLRARFPHGKNHTRRFARAATLRAVLDWAATGLPEPPEDMEVLEPSAGPDAVLAEFVLVRSGLGSQSKQVFSVVEADKTLEALNFATRESLLVNWAGRDADSEDPDEVAAMEVRDEEEQLKEAVVNDSGDTGQAEPAAASFSAALQQAEQKHDQELEANQLEQALRDSMAQAEADGMQEPVDKIAVYHQLIANGLTPHQAAQTAQHFSPQIRELEIMGFSNHAKNVELLQRYQGRLERVINLLAGGD